MLVLTRKQQEKIHIGDSITITILRVKGQAVRVGIEAPDGVRILRGELAEREMPTTAAPPATDKPVKESRPTKIRTAKPQRNGRPTAWQPTNTSLLKFRATPSPLTL